MYAHAIADFALQSDTMIKCKSWKENGNWLMWFIAHAFINGAMVYFVTGSMKLGLIETVLHGITDAVKCGGFTNPDEDQEIHIAYKAAMAIFS